MDMKGIRCCGECCYYSMKNHKCTRGFHEGTAKDSFYTDCDLPDVQPVKHGRWIESKGQKHIEITYECSECGHEIVGEYEKTKFCGDCGARMDGDSE